MKKIKVLHLITRFIRGGADENTMYTVLGLSKNKYDITLAFGSDFNHDMVDKVKKSRVKTKSFPIKHFNLFTLLYSLFLIYRFIKKERFNIVHTHSTEAGIIGRMAAKLARVPIIIHTIHGIAFTPYRSRILNKFVIYSEKLVDRFTTHFISNSNIMVREYLSRGIGNKNKFTTIYSGIDTEKFKLKKTKSKIPVITMIARLAEGKGHEYFIEAASQVLKKRKVEFWIVGDGELREEINKKIKYLNLDKNIKMLGEQNNIPQILSRTNVFVLPTLWEGTPRTIFEAMAARVPVITTPVGGIPEIIKDNKTGFLVKPKDSKALAEKIDFVLKNKRFVNNVVNNAYKLSSRFSYKNMVGEIDKVYKSLIRYIVE